MVIMQPLFVLLGIGLNGLVDSSNIQVFVNFINPDKPGSACDNFQGFILESLYDEAVAISSAAPNLDTIAPYWF